MVVLDNFVLINTGKKLQQNVCTAKFKQDNVLLHSSAKKMELAPSLPIPESFNFVGEMHR